MSCVKITERQLSNYQEDRRYLQHILPLTPHSPINVGVTTTVQIARDGPKVVNKKHVVWAPLIASRNPEKKGSRRAKEACREVSSSRPWKFKSLKGSWEMVRVDQASLDRGQIWSKTTEEYCAFLPPA